MLIGLIKIIRPINLLIMALTMVFLRYFFFKTNLSIFGIGFAATDLQYVFLILSVLMAAAAGYVINDLFDISSDKINHPDRSTSRDLFTRKQLITYYCILVLLSFISAAMSVHSGILPVFFTLLFTIVLFLYSYKLKGLPFIGNIVVSGTIAFIPAYSLLYDIPATIYNINADSYEYISKTILEEKFNGMVLFFMEMAFFINLIREVTKDIIDIEGDKEVAIRTIPIIYGARRTAVFASILTGVTVLLMLSHPVFAEISYSLSYFIVTTVPCMLLAVFFLLTSKYNYASLSLKIAMFMALMYLPIFHFIFGHHDI
jgi:4-hydroxybenzoate polyprenyltransferase